MNNEAYIIARHLEHLQRLRSTTGPDDLLDRLIALDQVKLHALNISSPNP